LRSRRQHAVLKIRHTVVKAVRDFLDNDGFTLCDAPIFTPAACEGTTTLFAADYFDGEKAYLTQSGQLYNEATAAAFGKVYCFGPTFRAEKSKTRRHLTEFWMVEPEMAYAALDDVMTFSERFLSYIAERVLAIRAEELKGCTMTTQLSYWRRDTLRENSSRNLNGAAISERPTSPISPVVTISR
jgi:asparaginyl-tRNA synthetase